MCAVDGEGIVRSSLPMEQQTVTTEIYSIVDLWKMLCQNVMLIIVIYFGEFSVRPLQKIMLPGTFFLQIPGQLVCQRKHKYIE